MNLNLQVAEVRRVSREIVRELGFLHKHVPTTSISHSQCHALTELKRHGKLSLAKLAELLRLDKSTTSRLASELEERGWIKITSCPKDKRCKNLTLTTKGSTQLQRIDEYADGIVESALRQLRDTDRQQVIRGMAIYAESLARARLRASSEIRLIKPEDDAAVAALIRQVMPEFGASGPGFALHDPEVDSMFAAYRSPKSAYFVITHGDRIVGGGGIAPLVGGEPGVCELRKMYFLPEARGLGLGHKLLTLCLAEAKKKGFRRCYLETLKGMSQAQRLYESHGFTKLKRPLGETGHFGCDTWYTKELNG